MTITELVFEGCTNSYANSFYRLVFYAIGKNYFAIRLIYSDVRSSWVGFLPEVSIVSRNLFFLESFEQISMYIHIGTPSCVSGGGGYGGVSLR